MKKLMLISSIALMCFSVSASVTVVDDVGCKNSAKETIAPKMTSVDAVNGDLFIPSGVADLAFVAPELGVNYIAAVSATPVKINLNKKIYLLNLNIRQCSRDSCKVYSTFKSTRAYIFEPKPIPKTS